MIFLLYISFCLVLAYINYRLIKYDRRILHGINGALHLLFWVGAFLYSRSWVLVAALPLLGRLFFDAALNVMRRLPLDYVASRPKSIIDKLEKRLFGIDGILPKLIYIVLITILLLNYYASR